MAPEQVDAETPAAPTLDVYGLTATLYQLLTLRPPYLGTPSQVVVSLQRRDPMPAYKVRPGLPRDLQAILDRGMARRPGARYQTAAALEAELRRFLAYQPVLARPRTLCGRAWSRLYRLRAVQVLAAAIVVLLATLAVNSWREHERAVRAQRWRDNWAPLPPNFALSPRLANRVVTDLLERDRIFALLDRAVRDSYDPIPSYLFRAAFRLDHGDSAGAAADLAAVGAHAGSEYATALVQRYRALPPHSAGARALDVGGLPPPRTPRDHYLAAFHALRAWTSPTSPQQARTLLEVAELADWAPAQELLGFILLLQATQERDPDQALTTFQRVHALAIALEAQLGRRTAPSALLLGAALSGQQRYGEALAVLREGQALSLWSYSMGSNLALVLRRTGQPEPARDILREMIARRPSLLHAYETLTGVYLDLRDYDAARATVAATPYPDDTAGHSERKFQEGLVEFAVTLAMQRAGTPCVEQAQRADALFRASGRDCREQRLAAAIAADDLDAQMRLVLEILEREPLDPDWLQNLEATLPPILDADLTQRLRALVAAQIEAARRLRGADAKPPKPPTTPKGNPNR
jgi:tetratricopeptide (TPR) repeat protein